MTARPFQDTPSRMIALAVAALAAGALAGAFVVQALGYQPCELCLLQRIAYYVGAPLALLAAFSAPGLSRWVLWALALIFLANAGLGVYHAGVEWKLWAGPQACTGSLQAAGSVADFMTQLATAQVVRCDEPAIRILGVSMAGWSALLCSGLAAASAAGAMRAGREA